MELAGLVALRALEVSAVAALSVPVVLVVREVPAAWVVRAARARITAARPVPTVAQAATVAPAVPVVLAVPVELVYLRVPLVKVVTAVSAARVPAAAMLVMACLASVLARLAAPAA